jgi:hypothetical protein
MPNFEKTKKTKKTKKNKKTKDLATSPDIRVVVETLVFLFFCFFCFFWFAPVERKKSRVNPRIFAGLSTAKTTILQFGLDDCAVRVGGFCSSG